jgi:hypothetical protein
MTSMLAGMRPNTTQLNNYDGSAKAQELSIRDQAAKSRLLKLLCDRYRYAVDDFMRFPEMPISMQPEKRSWLPSTLTDVLARPYGTPKDVGNLTLKYNGGLLSYMVTDLQTSTDMAFFSIATMRSEQFRISRQFSRVCEVGSFLVAKWDIGLERFDDTSQEYAGVAKLSFDPQKPSLQQLIIRDSKPELAVQWHEPTVEADKDIAGSYLYMMTQLAANQGN